MQFRGQLHRGYGAMTAALFLTLVCIALFVDDRIIRPYGGDVLAVAFLYCMGRAILSSLRLVVAAAVLAIAVGLEALQAADFLARLGLEHIAILRVLVGTTADWHDVWAYAGGIILSLGIDAFVAQRRSL